MTLLRNVQKSVFLLTLLLLLSAAVSGATAVGEWPFDEGSGQTVDDVSGNNNDGVLGTNTGGVHDPTWLPSDQCYSGTCLFFDGSNSNGEFVTVDDDPSLAVDNITLEAWINPTSYVGNVHSVIMAKEQQYKIALSNGSVGSAGEFIGGIVNTTECPTWCGPDLGYATSGFVVPQDTWTHVAMTYNETHFNFYINGNSVANVSSFKITRPTVIEDNNYALGIGGRDPNGNIGGPHYFFNGSIDRPAIYTEVLDHNEVKQLPNNAPTISNPSPSDGGSSDTDPTSLSADISDGDGDTVSWTIYDESGSPLNSGSVSGSGTATASYSGLSPGTTYDWTVEADDGEDIVTETYSFTYANNAPTATNPDPSDGAVVSASDQTVSAFYDDPEGDSGELRFYDASDGSLINSCSVTDENRCGVSWSGLSDGSHSWYAVAEDNEGNSAQSSTWSFTVDTTNPSITSLSHSPTTPTDSDSVTIDTSASDSATSIVETRIYVDGSLVETCSSSSCSTSVGPFSAGSTHTYTVEADDEAGNTASDSGSFTVDQAPAAPTNPSPSDGATIGTADPSLSADYSDPDGDSGQLHYYDASDDSLIGSCSVNDGGQCSVTWSGRSDGQHSWYAVAEDVHGDTAQSSTWTFTVDTSVSTQITGPSTSTWYDSGTISVSVDDADDATTCEWRVDDGNDGTWDTNWNSRSCPDGGFTVDVGSTGVCSTEGADECLVQVRAEDSAGNSNTDNAAFNIDLTPPTITLNSPSASTSLSGDFQADIGDSDPLSGPATCEYKVWDDADPEPGVWSSRPCPDGDVHPSSQISVGSSGTCHSEGTDTCNVRVRTTDNAGNAQQQLFEFDINYPSVDINDNYTGSGWQNEAQPVRVTCDDNGNPCGQVDWRIVRGGTVVDPSGGGWNTAPGPVSQVDVLVGDANNGDLTLEYRGWDQFGQEVVTGSENILVDKADPDTTIPDDSTYYEDDFTYTAVTDTDTGGSDVDSNRCEYKTNDDGAGWSASWRSRPCGEVSVTVGQPGSGADCTTEGQDVCGIRTRVWDNAGNSDTATQWFNIDYSGPQTQDNYTDDAWKTSPQPIQITCSDDGSSCASIEWWITYQNGTIVESPVNDSGTTTDVMVGDDANGELFLYYRGWDNTGRVERPTNEQRVRVDNNGPQTNITGADPEAWYNDDITVSVNDTGSISGLGGLDLYYLADTSLSFEDEWNTLADNVMNIENQVEDRTGLDVDTNVWGMNNSWDGRGGWEAICMPGQTLPDSFDPAASCNQTEPIIDDITHTKPYLDWLNDRFPSAGHTPVNYDPDSRGEAPKEGWGMGILDIWQRVTWRPQAHRAIINVGDQDTNGGDEQQDWCGDTNSTALATYLANSVQDKNISVFSMLGDTECDQSSPDPAREQMDEVGDVLDYNNADEMPDLIINALDDYNASGCTYRITDANTGATTGWQERDCPNGGFTVPIGNDPGDICTSEGEDACIVESKVNSTSGSFDIHTERFNVDLSAPNATCDDCDTPDPVALEKSVTFVPSIADEPQPNNAGWEYVEICQDSTCSDPYCSFTNPTGYCDYQTGFPYGRKPYCIYTEDTIGNNKTVCDPSYSFTVLGTPPDDPCNSDQQCLFGSCRRGVCSVDNLPPPGLILH